MHTPHSHRPLKSEHVEDVLHVIAVVSNPVRYLSRYALYEQFEAHVLKNPAVRLVTVELAFGDRGHEVTDTCQLNHLQLRSSHELWHKENMVNLGMRLLPRDWKYVAWVDADVEFLSPSWAQETLHQLQHHPVVQMFESAVDLGPRENVIGVHQGFGAQLNSGAPMVVTSGNAYGYGAGPGAFWHPGFAWAARREFIENVGGLIDGAILGSADHHMALGMIGCADRSLPEGIHDNYKAMVMDWQHKALRAGNKDIGHVPGSIVHHWHGPKAKRYYVARWATLIKHEYDPRSDIRYSASGVLELVGNKPQLRDDLRRYFRARDEDSRTED